MNKPDIALCALNAKYVHVSPAPWCLAAGVKKYAPELYGRINIIDGYIAQPHAIILEKITRSAPKIIGFSCYIWNIDAVLQLCLQLKSMLEDIIIVLGGPEVSYCTRQVLENNPQIDYILAGEGEESFPAFLRAVFAQNNNAILHESAAQNIPGLCGRRSGGGIYTSPPCTLKHDVPSPLTAGYTDAVHNRIAYFETSRGCNFSCAFCLSGGSGTARTFNLKDVTRDLLRLANSGARIIKFVDRTFNAHPAHANTILRFIADNYDSAIPAGTSFHFEIAGDIMREETFFLLEKMPVGVVQLEIGIQSFCAETLTSVCRKTNIPVLRENIKRLLAMGNMHIHIDLIAGLPHEGISTFAASFNAAYTLNAHMLQLGFLKLLHGSRMRSAPQDYPCEFDSRPPYQVISTPWLTQQDIQTLHLTENALNLTYNSGRFSRTVEYVLKISGLTPFEFYTRLGAAAREANVHHSAPLDDFTAVFKMFCECLDNVDTEELRDMLVRDRLSSNASGQLPPCLFIRDDKLSAAAWHIAAAHPVPKATRRGMAILYAARSVCWVDYIPENKHPITGGWQLSEIPLDALGL